MRGILCPVCGQKFSTRSAYSKHHIHHPETATTTTDNSTLQVVPEEEKKVDLLQTTPRDVEEDKNETRQHREAEISGKPVLGWQKSKEVLDKEVVKEKKGKPVLGWQKSKEVLDKKAVNEKKGKPLLGWQKSKEVLDKEAVNEEKGKAVLGWQKSEEVLDKKAVNEEKGKSVIGWQKSEEVLDKEAVNEEKGKPVIGWQKSESKVLDKEAKEEKTPTLEGIKVDQNVCVEQKCEPIPGGVIGETRDDVSVLRAQFGDEGQGQPEATESVVQGLQPVGQNYDTQQSPVLDQNNSQQQNNNTSAQQKSQCSLALQDSNVLMQESSGWQYNNLLQQDVSSRRQSNQVLANYASIQNTHSAPQNTPMTRENYAPQINDFVLQDNHSLSKNNASMQQHWAYQNNLVVQQYSLANQPHSARQQNYPVQRNYLAFHNNLAMQGNDATMQQDPNIYNTTMQQTNNSDILPNNSSNSKAKKRKKAIQQNNNPLYENRAMDQSSSVMPVHPAMAVSGGWGPVDRSLSTIDNHCTICRHTFFSRLDLMKHWKQFHCTEDCQGSQSTAPLRNTSQYQCGICMERFRNERLLIRHMTVFHRNVQNAGPSCIQPLEQNSGNVQEVGGYVGKKLNQTGSESGHLLQFSNQTNSLPHRFQLSSSGMLSNHEAMMNNAGLHYLNPNYAGSQSSQATMNHANAQRSLLTNDVAKQSPIVRMNAEYHKDIASYQMKPTQSQEGNFNSGQTQFNANTIQDNGVRNLDLLCRNVNLAANTYNNVTTPANDFPAGYQFPTQIYPEANTPNSINSEVGFCSNRLTAGELPKSASVRPTAMLLPNAQQQSQPDLNVPGGFPPDIEMRNVNGVNNQLLRAFSNMAVRPTSIFPVTQPNSLVQDRFDNAGNTTHPSDMDCSYFNKSQDLGQPATADPTHLNTPMQFQQTFDVSNNSGFKSKKRERSTRKIRFAEFTNLASCQKNPSVAKMDQEPMQSCQISSSMPNSSPTESQLTNQPGNEVSYAPTRELPTPMEHTTKPAGITMEHQRNSPKKTSQSSKRRVLSRPTTFPLKSNQMELGSNSLTSSPGNLVIDLENSDEDREKNPSLKRGHEDDLSGKHRQPQKRVRAQINNDTPHRSGQTLSQPQQNSNTINLEKSSEINKKGQLSKLLPPDLVNFEIPSHDNPQQGQHLPGIETILKKPFAILNDGKFKQGYGQTVTNAASKLGELTKTTTGESESTNETNVLKLNKVQSTTKSIPEDVNGLSHSDDNVKSSALSAVISTEVLPVNEVKLTTSRTIDVTTNYVVEKPGSKEDASSFKISVPPSLAAAQPRTEDVQSEPSRVAPNPATETSPMFSPLSSPETLFAHSDNQYCTTLGTMEQLATHLANQQVSGSHKGTITNLPKSVMSHSTTRTLYHPCPKRSSNEVEDDVPIPDDDTIPPALKTNRSKAYIHNLQRKIHTQRQMMSSVTSPKAFDESSYRDGKFPDTSPSDQSSPSETTLLNHHLDQPSTTRQSATRKGMFENDNLATNTLPSANNQANFNNLAGSVNETNEGTTPQFQNGEMLQVNNMTQFSPATVNPSLQQAFPLPFTNIAMGHSNMMQFPPAAVNQNIQQPRSTPFANRDMGHSNMMQFPPAAVNQTLQQPQSNPFANRDMGHSNMMQFPPAAVNQTLQQPQSNPFANRGMGHSNMMQFPPAAVNQNIQPPQSTPFANRGMDHSNMMQFSPGTVNQTLPQPQSTPFTNRDTGHSNMMQFPSVTVKQNLQQLRPSPFQEKNMTPLLAASMNQPMPRTLPYTPNKNAAMDTTPGLMPNVNQSIPPPFYKEHSSNPNRANRPHHPPPPYPTCENNPSNPVENCHQTLDRPTAPPPQRSVSTHSSSHQDSNVQAVDDNIAYVELASVAPVGALYVYRCSQCYQTFKTSQQAKNHTSLHNATSRGRNTARPPIAGASSLTRPVIYALPQDVDGEHFIMQEFLLEQPPTMQEVTRVQLVQAVVALPVKKKVTGRVTIQLTLIPND